MHCREVKCVLLDISNLLNAINSGIHTFKFKDIADILFLTFLLYAVFRLLRETRAGQLIKGIGVLAVVYAISSFADLRAMKFISENALKAGTVAILVLFQPEIRRMLDRFGQTTSRISQMTFGSRDEVTRQWENAIPVLGETAKMLSDSSTGALIVLERSTKLGEQILNGTMLNATPSKELFGNLFYNKAPLHDGAIIMRDGLILAAGCKLPLPQKHDTIDKSLGTRHRAAIGMSEVSDAVVIVVSEETGRISVAQNGVLSREFTQESLEKLLYKILIQPSKESLRAKALNRFQLLGGKNRQNASAEQPEKEE